MLDNFYENWFLFYGKFETYLVDGVLNGKCITFLEEYLQSYFFGEWGKKIPQNTLENLDKYAKPKPEVEGENSEDRLKYSTLVSRYAVTGLPKFSLTRPLFL